MHSSANNQPCCMCISLVITCFCRKSSEVEIQCIKHSTVKETEVQCDDHNERNVYENIREEILGMSICPAYDINK